MRSCFIVVVAALTLVGCGPQSEFELEEGIFLEEGDAQLGEGESELRRRHKRRGNRYGEKHHHGQNEKGNKGGRPGYGQGHGHGHHSSGKCKGEHGRRVFDIDGPKLSDGTLCAGEQVLIWANVEASYDVEALVYLTIHNEDGDLVFERFFPQSFEDGRTYSFEATYLTDATTPPGKYAVRVRVVDSATDDELKRSASERLRIRDPRSRRCAEACSPWAS